MRLYIGLSNYLSFRGMLDSEDAHNWYCNLESYGHSKFVLLF